MRQRLQLAENGLKSYIGRDVDTADQDQIAFPSQKVPDPNLGSDQRGGAGSVYREIGPHQIQAIGDASCGKIRDERGCSVGIENRKFAFSSSLMARNSASGQLRAETLNDPQGILCTPDVLHHGQNPPVQVIAPAHDDLRTIAFVGRSRYPALANA